LAKLPYGSPLRLHHKNENKTLLWRQGLTALKFGLWGRGGGARGREVGGLGLVYFFHTPAFWTGVMGEKLFRGLGGEKLSSSFNNFRGGFFLHASVTHILGLTTLDTNLSKSFLRLGIYYISTLIETSFLFLLFKCHSILFHLIF